MNTETGTDAEATQEQQAERVLVKWNSPTEETMGIARLAQAHVERKMAERAQICILVPSHNWAVQMVRACAQIELPAVTCIPNPHLTTATRDDLAKLALLADPADKHARADWAALGHSDEDATQLITRLGGVKGFALLKEVPLGSHPELEGAMLRTVGDEDAAQLLALVKSELAHPTTPIGMEAVPIAHYRKPLEGTFDYVFLVGCVDGLIPGPAAYEAPSEQTRAREYAQAREAFTRALGIARKRTLISGFVRADAALAHAAHLRVARERHDGGHTLAVTRMSPFLTEMGANRPSTMGSQALLKAYGLN